MPNSPSVICYLGAGQPNPRYVAEYKRFASQPMSGPLYERAGFCPVCRKKATFTSYSDWYRDSLVCGSCPGYSIPRERALMRVLALQFPNWQTMSIHESSPADRGASYFLRRECASYVGSQFYKDMEAGTMRDGYRCENLEAQTFADASFDLVISLDVMEHVNDPDKAVKEIARTLKAGGAYVFTAPTYKSMIESVRKSEYQPDGSIVFQGEPEYHGNPIDPTGSPVTFHYGYDLPELIHRWSGLNVTMFRFHDHYHGIIGEMTEVYVCVKEG